MRAVYKLIPKTKIKPPYWGKPKILAYLTK